MTEINSHNSEELKLVANVRQPAYPRFSMEEIEESLEPASILHERYGQKNLVRGETIQNAADELDGDIHGKSSQE